MFEHFYLTVGTHGQSRDASSLFFLVLPLRLLIPRKEGKKPVLETGEDVKLFFLLCKGPRVTNGRFSKWDSTGFRSFVSIITEKNGKVHGLEKLPDLTFHNITSSVDPRQ